MKLLAEEIDTYNAEEWESFIGKQPTYPVFQSARLFLTLRENSFHKAYGRLFRDVELEGEIAAGYVFFVIQEMKGLAAILATRVILNGGPVIKRDCEACLGEVLDDLINHPGLKGPYLEVWNGTDRSESKDVFRLNGFTYSPHLNYIIDLSKGRDQIWDQIQGRKKRYIKKNFNSLHIRLATSLQDLSIFYDILKETFSRIKLPLVDFSVFENIYKNDLGLFILAEKGDEGVACRLVIKLGTSLYDWYAGSVAKYSYLHVNESMVWWVLDYGLQHGYTRFDFGGAGRPDQNYGVRNFKAEFGGTLINYGRYKYIRSRIKNVILKTAIVLRAKWMESSFKKASRGL